jgi:hypothetical protein
MLNYYAHRMEDRVERIYAVQADSSDEQQFLAFAGMWNRDFPNCIQRVSTVWRVEAVAGDILPMPSAFYPPKRKKRSAELSSRP